MVYTVPCECNNNMFNVNNYYPSSSSLSIRTSKNKCVLTAMKLNLYKIAFLPHNNCNVSDPYFHYLEFRTTKKELRLKMKIASLLNIPVAIYMGVCSDHFRTNIKIVLVCIKLLRTLTYKEYCTKMYDDNILFVSSSLNGA